MRSAEEVPVHYLVADSGAFIKRAPLQDFGVAIYSVREVIDGLKCGKSRHLLESIPYEIVIQEPSKQSLQIVSECSKKTGDYAALSAVGLNVLALTHDLHVQECGSDTLNYECKRTLAQNTLLADKGDEDLLVDDEGRPIEKTYDTLAGFYNPSSVDKENDEYEEDDESDEEGWLDESNIDDSLLQMGAVAVPDKHMKKQQPNWVSIFKNRMAVGNEGLVTFSVVILNCL